MTIIIWAIIGIVAGWLAGKITNDDHSIWGDLILGLLGAFVAGYIFNQDLGTNNLVFSIIAATIAAVILVLVKNWIMGSRARG